jgi:aspartyl-tRNA(Asn)/glutamyl-tRNA(Gln) amidotransferase subunit A
MPVSKGLPRRFAPTTCIPAPKIGQVNVSIGGREVSVYSSLNRLTLPFNYVGFPAISIPSGMVDGAPLGVQLVGRLLDEVSLLRFVHSFEEKFGPFGLPPPLERQTETS